MRKNNHYPITLIIDNQSSDTLRFNDFRKYIPNRTKRGQKYIGFCWDIKTLKNGRVPRLEFPEIPFNYNAKPKKNSKYEKSKVLIIKPHTTKNVDIYLYNTIPYYTEDDYFILYLYYGNEILKPIAKTVIFYE